MTEKQFRDVENTLLNMIMAKNKSADVVLSAVDRLVTLECEAPRLIKREIDTEKAISKLPEE